MGAKRAMSEALYVCTGQVQEAGLSHYGLGLEKYSKLSTTVENRFCFETINEMEISIALVSIQRTLPLPSDDTRMS